MIYTSVKAGNNPCDTSIPDISIMVQSDLAFEIGTYTAYGSGKYIVIWILQDSVWKILLDTNW